VNPECESGIEGCPPKSLSAAARLSPAEPAAETTSIEIITATAGARREPNRIQDEEGGSTLARTTVAMPTLPKPKGAGHSINTYLRRCERQNLPWHSEVVVAERILDLAKRGKRKRPAEDFVRVIARHALAMGLPFDKHAALIKTALASLPLASFDGAELIKILSFASRNRTEQGMRDAAFLGLRVFTSLEAGKILELRRDDIGGKGVYWIRGRDEKMTSVMIVRLPTHLSDCCPATALERWLDHLDARGDTGTLWFSRRGEVLGLSAFQRMVARVVMQATGRLASLDQLRDYPRRGCPGNQQLILQAGEGRSLPPVAAAPRQAELFDSAAR
jgi:integrase